MNELPKGWVEHTLGGLIELKYGKPLPANDYWFKADVQVEGKLIVLTGNFSLIR